MSKKGQITVFIIIGIIVLLVLAIFLSQRQLVVKAPEAPTAINVAPVQSYIQGCLEKTAKDAVLTVALQGGYYLPPENSLRFLGVNMPYYIYEGNVSIPTQEQIENELSLYVNSNLAECANLDSFAQRGYNISTGLSQVKSMIGSRNVIFRASYPVIIKINNQEQTISDFTTDVNANLMNLYNTAKLYTDQQKDEQSGILLSRLMAIASRNDITFETFTFGGEEALVSFIDNSTRINNQPLIFAFAIKYPPFNATKLLNQKLGR